MAAKNKFMNAMKMPAIADMFSSEAERQRESGDLVTEVPLSELHPFVNHPFEVRDDEDMNPFLPAPITQVSLNATRRALLPYSALLVLLKESAMIFNQNDPKRTSDYQKRKYGL